MADWKVEQEGNHITARKEGWFEHTDVTIEKINDEETAVVRHHDVLNNVHTTHKYERINGRWVLSKDIFTFDFEWLLGIFALFPLVMCIFGLFAFRNATYTIMASPVIIFQLASGQGMGWILLALCVIPAIIWAVIAHFTEKTGVILAIVWSFVAGILLMIYHAKVNLDQTYVYNFPAEYWTDIAGVYIGTVVHVFFFMMTIQTITMLLSFQLSHIFLFWTGMTVLFTVMNFLSVVFMAFGSDYPTTAARYYQMIEPLCHCFGLSKECILPHLQWLANISSSMPLYCLLFWVAILIIVVIRFFLKPD